MMSFVEVLLCYLLVAMVVVGGALYGLVRLIIWMNDHHWEI